MTNRNKGRVESILNFAHEFFMSAKYLTIGIPLILLFDFALNLLIIRKISYVEIDWKAYMQQAGTVLSGERNYLNIRGGTGPLVYPAGFLWIYIPLYYLTDKGTNIRFAQHIFMAVYMATLYVVCRLYSKDSKVPLWVYTLLPLSRRLHSIYILRLFNDPFAALFAFLGSHQLIAGNLAFSSILFSLGISVKMNILLWMPGFLFVVYRKGGLKGTAYSVFVLVATQITVAIPFLVTFPREYMAKSFEFNREFLFVWTVNWRMVGELVFASKLFATALLACHLTLLVAFAYFGWSRPSGGLVAVIKRGIFGPVSKAVTAHEVLSVLFTSNFIGLIFSRSLHYQFYSWYYFTLPYMVYTAGYSPLKAVAVMVPIEICWNIFPSTTVSSTTLLVCHLLLLGDLLVCQSTAKDTSRPKALDQHLNKIQGQGQSQGQLRVKAQKKKTV